MEVLLSFERTNDAIQAEQLLLNTQLDVQVMNLPSSIRAGCGICLRIKPGNVAAACSTLALRGIAPAGLYTRRTEQGKSVYAPFDSSTIEV